MEKTIKKLILAVVALSLMLVCVVGGVIAWLTAESGTVTNSFTYGNITINLTENVTSDAAGITAMGSFDAASGKGSYTNIVPGDVLAKNPVVTVKSGSEKCYVYVLIKNELGDSATYNIDLSNWEFIVTTDKGTLYRYDGTAHSVDSIVNALSGDVSLDVFTTLTFKGTLDKAALDALGTNKVVITAYAHQADNTTMDVADAAAIDWATP